MVRTSSPTSSKARSLFPLKPSESGVFVSIVDELGFSTAVDDKSMLHSGVSKVDSAAKGGRSLGRALS